MNHSKRTYLFLIGFVSVALLALLFILLFSKGPKETPPTPPPDNSRVENQIKQDEVLLQNLAPEDKPIKGENFEIFYFDQTESFLAIIHTGDREEEIQRIYQTLRERGIKNPEDLNIVFSGPRTYEDYKP